MVNTLWLNNQLVFVVHLTSVLETALRFHSTRQRCEATLCSVRVFTFSTDKKESQSMLANILIPVYCHCGRPDSLDEMIQCDVCDVYFHFQCAHIKRALDSDWFCSTCAK